MQHQSFLAASYFACLLPQSRIFANHQHSIHFNPRNIFFSASWRAKAFPVEVDSNHSSGNFLLQLSINPTFWRESQKSQEEHLFWSWHILQSNRFLPLDRSRNVFSGMKLHSCPQVSYQKPWHYRCRLLVSVQRRVWLELQTLEDKMSKRRYFINNHNIEFFHIRHASIHDRTAIVGKGGLHPVQNIAIQRSDIR